METNEIHSGGVEGNSQRGDHGASDPKQPYQRGLVWFFEKPTIHILYD